MARQGEAAPQYSSFLHLHFILQILSDKQLLSEYNLSWCSFWETYLITSDPQHKGWTYTSSLFCSRKLLRKSFPFCLFLKFWTEIEEYLLRNTYYSSLTVPPRTDGLCPYSPVSAPTQVLDAIPSPPIWICSCGVSTMVGRAWEREKEDPRSLLLPGS